jgi:hypothetical protein
MPGRISMIKFVITEMTADLRKDGRTPPFPGDTHPAIRSMMVKLLRAMTVEEKVETVNGLNRACEALALAGIRERHPHADPEEVRMRLGVIQIGPDLMRRVFGWDVKVHGY